MVGELVIPGSVPPFYKIFEGCLSLQILFFLYLWLGYLALFATVSPISSPPPIPDLHHGHRQLNP